MVKHFILGCSHGSTIIKTERIARLICFDKVGGYLERKKTMDLELQGYLERWNICFWIQSGDGCQ